MQNWRQRAVVLGQADHVDAFARHDLAVDIGEHIKLAAARAHFLNVGFQLVEHGVVGRDGDDRHLAGDERERAVL